MNDHGDELMERLAGLDPVLADSPPAIGSPRFNASKEHAMSTHTTESLPTEPSDPRQAHGPEAKRRPRMPLVASIAAVLVACISLVLVLPGLTAATAAEKVRSAASNSTDITSLRIDVETDSLSFVPDGKALIEVAGEEARMIDETFELYLLDEGSFFIVDGTVMPLEGTTDEIAPYPEASKAVIDAALQSEQVTESGTERVGDVDATRYVVEIDDSASVALAAVPTRYLNWFTEETEEEVDTREGDVTESRSGFLDEADVITIWVADDLIHRISVDSPDVQFTHTYYDFNAPIEISLPSQ